jgi:hypothetical protein
MSIFSGFLNKIKKMRIQFLISSKLKVLMSSFELALETGNIVSALETWHL